MKRWFALGLGALAVAGTGLALLPSLRLHRLDPPAPQPAPADAAPGGAARPVTALSAPLDLPLRAIVDLANAKGPAALSGTQALPHLKQSAETGIAWTLSRSAFTGTNEAGRIVLGAALTGGGSLRGRTRTGRATGGGPSRTLPRAFNESIDLAADIWITAEPRLTSAWRVEPGFQASASLRQGETRIADLFTLDLRAELLPRIERSLNQELEAAGTRIANAAVLEQAGRAAWDRLCTSLEIPPKGGQTAAGPSSVWLDIEPKGWTAGQPVLAAQAFRFPLTARASVSLSDAPRSQAECEPFPERLELAENASAGAPRDGRITLGTGLDMAALGRAATDEIARAGPLTGEGVSAQLDAVGLSALGERVLVAVDGRFRQRGLLGVSAEGRLHFLARPRLDPEGAALSLEEVAIEPGSAEALAQAGGGLSATVPEIARRLGALRLDLAPQRDRLRAMAVAARGLEGMDGPLGVAQVAVGEIRLVALRPDGRGLRLRAEAEGSLALKPVTLSP